jgi:predicted anti-sigma-YlaC factor YlaD
MDCARIREALLELPDVPEDLSVRYDIEAHLPGCPECQRWHEALTRVDEGLSRHFQPPLLEAGFRERLGARVARERQHVWADWLPAAVHFASCGVATALCVAVLPDQAAVVAVAAAGITVASHFLLTTAHSAFDAAGDNGY